MAYQNAKTIIANAAFRIAFERAIELDPSNIDSRAALAVLQITSPQKSNEMRAGIITLGSLYKHEKDNPLILNHLANHFFLKGVCLLSVVQKDRIEHL